MSRGFIPGDQFEEKYAPRQRVTVGLTANAGGGQSGATPLPTAINRVATVATAGDSVLLPTSADNVGAEVTVINAGANSLNVFPQGADTIDGAASKAVAAGKSAAFFSVAAGIWHSLASA